MPKLNHLNLLVSLIAAPILAACAGALPSAPRPMPTITSASGDPSVSDLLRTDSQGAVEFSVLPLNLDSPGPTLEFKVSMNTHSEILSWDLAAQSTLTTDNGLRVSGLSWPGVSGHHAAGRLVFSSRTSDGRSLLQGARTLELRIVDTDVPARTFTWSLAR